MCPFRSLRWVWSLYYSTHFASSPIKFTMIISKMYLGSCGYSGWKWGAWCLVWQAKGNSFQHQNPKLVPTQESNFYRLVLNIHNQGNTVFVKSRKKDITLSEMQIIGICTGVSHVWLGRRHTQYISHGTHNVHTQLLCPGLLACLTHVIWKRKHKEAWDHW